MDYAVLIDGELIETDKLFTKGYLPMLSTRKREWYLAEDSDKAKEAAMRQWKDMDAKELVAMIGEEKIVDAWMSGQSMDDWLEENIEPEAEFGSYDGNELDVKDIDGATDEMLGIDDLSDTPSEDEEDSERDVRRGEISEAWDNLISEIGFTPTVAYRHN